MSTAPGGEFGSAKRKLSQDTTQNGIKEGRQKQRTQEKQRRIPRRNARKEEK